ncbi:MAG: M3 family oligoendopeptidase [Bacteroidia bacterium]|jgi:oligoendopeptidase F|nr:M3 family oligoendopeptidase [Bacteroidia bacterium]
MKRHYVKPEFKVSTWELLQTYFDELEKRPIHSFDELYKWLLDYNELGAVVSEDMAWRYIKMTCDTNNTALRDSYNDFVQNIEPKMAPISNRLNEKLMASPFKEQLKKQGYPIYLRGIKNSIDLFREKNIPLNTQLQELEQKFGEISGAQSIEHNGETITLQKAGVFLKDLNREVRKTVYDKVQTRRAQDETALNDLFNQLVKLRQQVALNTGFKNYRDFKHQQLARFDYSVQDCLNFHESVKQHAVPLVDEHDKRRKAKLKLEDYRPWDTSVDEEGLPPLKPFQSAQELIDKTIACFNRLDPFFGDCVATMHKMNRLDLESRIGKAPGGYQYPLYETNVPFIFMNSVGLHRDLVTMVHEGGHAIHSFLDFDLELVEFKSPPSEIAELASMSMELMSMEHWEVFFADKEELRRAKRQQLESVIDALPWIAAIDKFQHWIYTHPEHTVEDRYTEWKNIMKDFGSSVIDYRGCENHLARRWQVQLHLYEVPFYYIEYGFAQLGAIAVWRNYKKDPKKAVEQYKAALALGYTKSIPEVYAAAGIKFDFSPAYIKELMDFVKGEYESV